MFPTLLAGPKFVARDDFILAALFEIDDELSDDHRRRRTASERMLPQQFRWILFPIAGETNRRSDSARSVIEKSGPVVLGRLRQFRNNLAPGIFMVELFRSRRRVRGRLGRRTEQF